MSDNKPKATIKACKNSGNLPESYIKYTPYVSNKKTDKLKTYGIKRERHL